MTARPISLEAYEKHLTPAVSILTAIVAQVLLHQLPIVRTSSRVDADNSLRASIDARDQGRTSAQARRSPGALGDPVFERAAERQQPGIWSLNARTTCPAEPACGVESEMSRKLLDIVNVTGEPAPIEVECGVAAAKKRAPAHRSLSFRIAVMRSCSRRAMARGQPRRGRGRRPQ